MSPAIVFRNPSPDLKILPWQLNTRAKCNGLNWPRRRKAMSPAVGLPSSINIPYSCSHPQPPVRYAVLGAGFAGLSVAWHLLQHSPEEMRICIDLFDDVGIGGGASGVSGGLLHPYSPKVKLLWQGAECWKESLKLLNVAEAAVDFRQLNTSPGFSRPSDGFIVRRRGILRPVVSLKHMNVLNDNAQDCLASCRIEPIDEYAAQKLVPNMCVPSNLAFHMPEAVNVHPQRYLEALYLACQQKVRDMFGSKELSLYKKSVNHLRELAGEYNAVIICLGARATFLPELSGRLPLRTCRGVTAHMQLLDNFSEDYPERSPSILSDAWLAVQGTRRLHLGSTWDWKSRDYSPHVLKDEASKALEELLPKASALYPSIKHWDFTGASAGLRAMPPLTSHGSLPLLGCVNDFVGGTLACKYWLCTGLGSRGLLYHGWLGKLMALAVLSCNESLIPSELTSWRNKLK